MSPNRSSGEATDEGASPGKAQEMRGLDNDGMEAGRQSRSWIDVSSSQALMTYITDPLFMRLENQNYHFAKEQGHGLHCHPD